MVIHSNRHRYNHLGWSTCLLFLSLCNGAGVASAHPVPLLRPDINWNVEGANGQLYVFGSLTESPCHIAMESLYQSVDMGNIETANLKQVGKTGKSVPVHIELLDCIETPTALTDAKTGNVTWSTEQPGIKVRFVAPSVPFYPQLAKVSGVQGIGLQLSDSDGKIIPLGESVYPHLLSPGQDVLTYFITPVRIASILKAGAYQALISFELMYD